MAVIPFEVVSQHRCFNGTVGFYKHEAASTACSMKFSVFTPPQAQSGRVPVLYYLAGLTCTEETFMIKAGAQRIANRFGVQTIDAQELERALAHAHVTRHQRGKALTVRSGSRRS